MKIALAQLNYHIGNFEGNVAKMLEATDRAKADGADIICFAELATCGYPPRDFLEFNDFIHLCKKNQNRKKVITISFSRLNMRIVCSLKLLDTEVTISDLLMLKVTAGL